jgi:outer membrane protein OmpA-like peptidoglycan-associated protein
MKLRLLAVILIGFSFIFASCAKDEKPTDPVTPQPTPTEPPTPPTPPAPPSEMTKDANVVIHFNFNSSKLHADQKKILKEVVAARIKNGTKATIVGYTDSQGSKKYNKKLSAKRAKAVSDYLTKLHVENTWTAKGEADLLNKDKTRSQHKVNRRAFIKFTVIIK